MRVEKKNLIDVLMAFIDLYHIHTYIYTNLYYAIRYCSFLRYSLKVKISSQLVSNVFVISFSLMIQVEA